MGHIGVVIMIQTLPMPLLHKIAGLELSDVRSTLAGTIQWLVQLDNLAYAKHQ
jgi:hypothetical protein